MECGCHTPALSHAFTNICVIYFSNQLAEGKYIVHGKPIALTDIAIPIFVVFRRDKFHHYSVFKINLSPPASYVCVNKRQSYVGIVSMPVKNQTLLSQNYFEEATAMLTPTDV